MTRDRGAARAFGLRAETLAACWLRLKFYKVLARSYAIREGEIDIIARRGRLIVFVEVKARPTLEAAAIAITPEKRRRIARAARHWLARHAQAQSCAWRGDAIFVAPGRWPRHVAGAVELDLG